MGAKVSAETKHALKLREEGLTVYEAAERAGIYPKTLYRAIARQEAEKVGKKKSRRNA